MELRDTIFDRLSDGYASGNVAYKINSWELLSTELRDMIFDRLSDGYANENDYFGVSCRCDHHIAVPPLLIALRSLPRSYHDALQRFKAANGTLATYFYRSPNGPPRLTFAELQAFQYLRYKIPYVLRKSGQVIQTDSCIGAFPTSTILVVGRPLLSVSYWCQTF